MIDKTETAQKEYDRLCQIYETAGVEQVKLDAYDNLIRKVAELFARLESIKDLPLIIVSRSDLSQQKETAAGRVLVKYMAQYTSAIIKLNRELLGAIPDDDGDALDDYKDDER